jgi:hypothetical protein
VWTVTCDLFYDSINIKSVSVEWVGPLLTDETGGILNEEVTAYSLYYPRRCLEELREITKSSAKIRPEYPQNPSSERYCYFRLLSGEHWIELVQDRVQRRVSKRTN